MRRAIRQRPITTEPEPDVRDGRKNNKGNPNWHKGMTKPEGSGRKPGQGNRMTSNLKTALMMAAEQIGEDGEGLNGLVGFLKRLEMRHPPSFARLLAMLLPLHIRGDFTERPVEEIDENTSVQDALERYLQTLRATPAQLPAPRVIEHDPVDMADVRPERVNGRTH